MDNTPLGLISNILQRYLVAAFSKEIAASIDTILTTHAHVPAACRSCVSQAPCIRLRTYIETSALSGAHKHGHLTLPTDFRDSVTNNIFTQPKTSHL